MIEKSATGDDVLIPRGQALRETERYLDSLMMANPQISGPVARDIALDMVKAKAGAAPASGSYIPTPQLNTTTGRWETAIKSGDKIVALVPSAVVEPTQEQVFDQESKWATSLVDSGDAAKLDAALKSTPELKARLVRAFNGDTAAAAALERTSPGIMRQFEVLHSHAGVGGIVPDEALSRKRQSVQATRKAMLENGGNGAPVKKPGVPLSDADRKKAIELGAKQAISPVDAVVEGVCAIGKGVGAVGGWMADNAESKAFQLGLESSRLMGFRNKTTANALADMIRKNPELKKQMTSEDIYRLQFAIDEQL